MKSHKCDHNYYHTEDGVNCAAHSQHSLLAVVTNRAILIKNWLQKYILACWFVCHCFLIRSLNYWKHPQSFTDWHNWTDQHYKSTPSNITDGSESFFFLFFSSHSPGPKRNKMDTSVTVSSKCKGQSHKTMSINKNFEEKLSQCTQRLCFGKIYIIIYTLSDIQQSGTVVTAGMNCWHSAEARANLKKNSVVSEWTALLPINSIIT